MTSLINPKIKGYICINSNPYGCNNNIQKQIKYIKKNIIYNKDIYNKNIIIIGSSTGYGLTTRLITTFAYKAKVLGLFLEKNKNNKTASTGWYNTSYLEKKTHKMNLYTKSINNNSFCNSTKIKTVNIIKKNFKKKIDLLIYSLASPKRIDPISKKIYKSELKPTEKKIKIKNINIIKEKIIYKKINKATNIDIFNTKKVMGGEDWELWINILIKNNLLNKNFKTVAYSYNGPRITHNIYKKGTIGLAKKHLENTTYRINKKLKKKYNGTAYISINQAIITQASLAIPSVALYLSLLNKIKKYNEFNQIFKLLNIITKKNKSNIIKLDNIELNTYIQNKINYNLNHINNNNIYKFINIIKIKKIFYKLFGFNFKKK